MNKLANIVLVILIVIIMYFIFSNNSNVLVATLEEESMTMEVTINYKNDKPDYVIMEYKMVDETSAKQMYSWLDNINEKYGDEKKGKVTINMPDTKTVIIEGDASIEELQFPRGSRAEAKKEFEKNGFKVK